MIVRDVTKPDNTIYYQSAFILKYTLKNKWYSIEELFSTVYERKKMSYKTFTYCMDFLYLSNLVEWKKGEEGYVYRIVNN